MKTRTIPLLALAALLSVPQLARAGDDSEETTASERYTIAAQKSFDRGQYKQAESLWTRALTAMEEAATNNADLANTLKRLGETLLKEGKYPEADSKLKRAASLDQSLAIADAELAGDQAMLSQLYRPVDTTLLGRLAQEALTQASLSSFCIIKKEDGVNHVQIQLPDRYTKHIDNKDVDQIGFDRVVTFDISTLPDGSVKIENIKGFRVRAGMWVTILQSIFRPAEAGQHVAEVTAGKMGITKTVSAHLNDDYYAPVNGLVSQLMVSGPTPASGHSSVPTTNNVSTTGSGLPTGSAAAATNSDANGIAGTAVTTSPSATPITTTPIITAPVLATPTTNSTPAVTNGSASTNDCTAGAQAGSAPSTAPNLPTQATLRPPIPATNP